MISPKSNSHEQSKAKHLDQIQCWCQYTIRQADYKNCFDYANDQFFTGDKFATKGVAKEPKGQLANVIADI